MHFFDVYGNQLRIHTLTVFVAQCKAVILADGFGLALQIYGDHRLGDLIDHGFGAGDQNMGIVQHRIGPADHIALGSLALVDNVHRDFLIADQPLHGNGDGIGILVFPVEGIAGHIAGIGDIIVDLMNTRIIDLGHIGLQGNIGAVQLIQIGTVAAEGQVHIGGGHAGDDQVPLPQKGLALHFDGDIQVGSLGVGAHLGDDVHPQAEGDQDRDGHGYQFIFHRDPPPSSAASASAAGPGWPRDHPDPGKAHCAAAFPGFLQPGGA